jgi:hypothetical protein
MITLTLPPQAWEEKIQKIGEEVAVAEYLQARHRFLDTLARRLSRQGYPGGWLWFQEFQEKRGAPHIHIILDLGGFLPQNEYQSWKEWLTREWSRVLGVPAPYATRIEALKKRDFRYTRKYASKPKQKNFPFPARWGRSWDTAGPWREILRQSRRTPTSKWILSTEEAYSRLRAVYESLAYQVPISRVYLTLRSLVEGFHPAPISYRGRIPLSRRWVEVALFCLTEDEPLPWDSS